MLTSCFLGKEQKCQKCFVFRKGKRGGGGGAGGGWGGEGAETCEEGALCYRLAKKETDTELQRTRNEGIVVGGFLNLT